MILSRRKLLTGLIAAPIVVRAGLIMPVKAIEVPDIHLLGIYNNQAIFLDGTNSWSRMMIEAIAESMRTTKWMVTAEVLQEMHA